MIDTDCDLGEYCSLAQRCEPIGGLDAGMQDAGEPMDSGEVDSGPADTGVDSGPEEIGVGNVIAINNPGAPGSYTVVASFSLVGAASPCTVSEPSEGCVLTSCPPPVMVMDAGMPADAGMPVAPTAGDIMIGGGVSTPITLSPNAEDGLYPPATGAMALWSGSDAILTVMAAGADVPMFGVTLAGTDAVTLTAPAAGNVPVASDLAVTWSGSSPGDVVVAMTAVRENTFSLECRFSPADGMGTVPTAALSAMGAGSAFLTVRSEQSRSITRTGWDVGVALQTPSGSVLLTLE